MQSQYGGVLLQTGNVDESIDLLTKGHDGLARTAESIPVPDRNERLCRALKRLIQSAETQQRPEDAAKRSVSHRIDASPANRPRQGPGVSRAFDRRFRLALSIGAFDWRFRWRFRLALSIGAFDGRGNLSMGVGTLLGCAHPAPDGAGSPALSHRAGPQQTAVLPRGEWTVHTGPDDLEA